METIFKTLKTPSLMAASPTRRITEYENRRILSVSTSRMRLSCVNAPYTTYTIRA